MNSHLLPVWCAGVPIKISSTWLECLFLFPVRVHATAPNGSEHPLALILISEPGLL